MVSDNSTVLGLAQGDQPQVKKLKKFCKNGHEFSPENTAYFPSSPNKRVCRTCHLGHFSPKRYLRTHCPQGHEYTSANTYVHPEGKRRACRICRTARSAAYKTPYDERRKTSVRTSQLKRFYKLSVDEYAELSKSGCEICGEFNANGTRLAVDHDHECCPGKVTCGKCIRGVLCNNHNNGLGRFKDNISHLRSAIFYLQGNKYFEMDLGD